MRISLDHLCKSFDGVEVLRDITFDEEVSALAIIAPLAVENPRFCASSAAWRRRPPAPWP